MMEWVGSAIMALAMSVAAWSPTPGKTTGLPEPGKAVGVAITDTPGRWLVLRAEPFEIVTELRTVRGEKENYVFWQGTAGKYTAVLIPSDEAAPLEFAAVTLGGSGPNPNPNPDPEPPPGKRQVLIIEEKDARTAQIAMTEQVVQDYCKSKGHDWHLIDDDTVDETGKTPERLKLFLSEMEKLKIKPPAIVVSANWQGKEHYGLQALPSKGEDAIQVIKQYGG